MNTMYLSNLPNQNSESHLPFHSSFSTLKCQLVKSCWFYPRKISQTHAPPPHLNATALDWAPIPLTWTRFGPLQTILHTIAEYLKKFFITKIVHTYKKFKQYRNKSTIHSQYTHNHRAPPIPFPRSYRCEQFSVYPFRPFPLHIQVYTHI